MRFYLSYILFFLLSGWHVAISQCPVITSSSIDQLLPASFCPGESMTFSVEGETMTDGSTIDWYLGTDPAFNAYQGEGVFQGSSGITVQGCQNQVEVLYVLVNVDGSNETCDEFVLLWTGSGGYTPGDIQITNFWLPWDQFVPGDPTIYSECSVIPLNTNDPVPPNSILIIQSSTDPQIQVDIGELCLLGLDIYVIAFDNFIPDCAGGYLGNSGFREYSISITGSTCGYSETISYIGPSPGVDGWGVSNATGAGVYNDSIPSVLVPSYIPETPVIADFTWTIPSDFCQNNPDGTYYISGILNPPPDIGCSEIFTDYFELQVSCPSAAISGGGNFCPGNCPADAGTVQLNFSGGQAPYVVDLVMTVAGFPDLDINGLVFDSDAALNICVEGNFPSYDNSTLTIFIPESSAGSTVTISIADLQDANLCPGQLDPQGVSVTVLTPPEAITPSEQSVCAGSPVQLNGSTGSAGSGLWMTGGDGSFDDPGLGNALYTPGAQDVLNGTVVLEWIVTDPSTNCAPDTAMTTLTILETAEITLAPEQTICSDQALSLDATANVAGWDVEWSTSGDGVFGDMNSLATVYTPGPGDALSGTVTLTIVVSDPSGMCPGAQEQQEVTVQEALSVDVPGTIAICPDEEAMLVATADGSFETVMWTTSGDGTFDNPSNEVTIYTPGPNDLLDGMVDLVILVSDLSAVCADASGFVTVIIEDCSCPDIGILVPADPVCNSPGSNLDLATLEVTAGPGTWAVSSAPAGTNPAQIAGTVLNAGGADPGIYGLTFSLLSPVAGCPADTSISLLVTDAPAIEITSDPAYCDPDSIGVFTALSGDPGAVWWETNGDGSFLADSTLSNIYLPGANDPLTGNFNLIAFIQDSAGVCPVHSDTLAATISLPPFASFDTMTLSVCNDPSAGSVLDLASVLSGGDLAGTWEVVSGPPVDLADLTLVDFQGIPPGNVVIEYTTASAVFPCTDSTYRVTVQVQDCGCPPLVKGQAPSVLCAGDTSLILNTYISGSDPGAWAYERIAGAGDLPGLFMDTLSLAATTTGLFELTYLLNAAPIDGCPDSVVFQLLITGYPGVTLPGDTLICADSDILLEAMTSGSASGGSWSTSAGDGVLTDPDALSTTYQPGPGDLMNGSVGVVFTAPDSSGACPEAMDTMLVSFADTAYTNFLEEMAVTCNVSDSGSVVDFSSFISGGDAGGSWTDIDGSGADLANLPAADFDGVPAGSYTFIYETASAVPPCSDQTYPFEVIVADCTCPSIALTRSDTSVCLQSDSIDLDSFLATAEPGAWKVSGTPGGSAPAVIANQSIFRFTDADTGIYLLTFTLLDSVPDCPASSTIAIRVQPPPEVTLQSIDCAVNQLSWEVTIITDGESSGPSAGDLAEVMPGVYQVSNIPLDETLVIEFTRPGTGCVTSVVVSPPSCNCTLDFEYDTDHTTCFGDRDGRIVIDTITGALGPVCVRLDGDSCRPINTFPFIIDSLAGGNYTLELRDSIGCLVNAEVMIIEPEALQADLGPDRFVEAGDTVFLFPSFNFTPSVWTYTPPVFPADSIAGRFIATASLTVVLSASDTSGCTATDQVLIDVAAPPPGTDIVFVPNVFTPNQDQRNDFFFPLSNEFVDRISRLSIYDRWGQLVFQQADFPPNEPSLGWDGNRNGSPMPAGVYVYQLVYSTLEREVILRGDVTLIR